MKSLEELDADVDPNGTPSIELARVAHIDLDFDKLDQSLEDSLFVIFANQPHARLFSGLNQKNWEQESQSYHERLVELAQGQNLPSKSLDKSLTRIRAENDDRTALIPVAAYLTRKGETHLWVVVAKWEIVGFGPTLTHVRMWAYSIPDCTLVGYATCD